jgi:hypothetical protein
MFGLMKRIKEQRAELVRLTKEVHVLKNTERRYSDIWNANDEIERLKVENERLRDIRYASREGGAILACEKKCAELEAIVVNLRLQLADKGAGNG